jgi:hypothetical protein
LSPKLNKIYIVKFENFRAVAKVVLGGGRSRVIIQWEKMKINEKSVSNKKPIRPERMNQDFRIKDI